MSTTTTLALKRTLRKELKAKLQALSASTLDNESDRVVKHLLDLEEFRSSKNISVYISMPKSEIRTRDIIRHILHSPEKSCYVPRWTKDSMEMVKIQSWDEYLSLPVNKWNIPEPPHDRVMENALDSEGLDLILVPAMGFDEQCNRIGHGKGYYDKYLQKCRAWAEEHKRLPPKTVGLALEAQILEPNRIPVEPTDEKLDCILTASRIIR